MLAPERERVILMRLDDGRGVRVGELAAAMGVTTETVRRDLRRLEGQGRLVRTHGGATPAEPSAAEVSFLHRRRTRVEVKRRLGLAAAQLVRPGQIIALDASTTCLELAACLHQSPLTVVTAAPEVCLAVRPRPGVTVLGGGGMFDAVTRSFVGADAERVLGRRRLDWAFFSCAAVDARTGPADLTEAQARLKRVMIEAADRAALLADASKFNARAAFPVARPGALHTVVTDHALPRDAFPRWARLHHVRVQR